MHELRVEVTNDPELIKRIWTDPVLFADITDDTPLDPETWEPHMGDPNIWLALYVQDELVGVWLLHQLNAATWQIHAGNRPDTWGSGIMKELGPMVIDTAFEVSEARKLYAMIPTYAEPVWRTAKRLGLKIEGTCRKCWLKDGELLDAYHMGVYR